MMKKGYLQSAVLVTLLCGFGTFGASTVMADVSPSDTNYVTGKQVYDYLHKTTVELGMKSSASQPFSIAAGYESSASGYASNAFGSSNTASGTFATAIGMTSIASGDAAQAVGTYNVASGDYSSVFGCASNATAYGATAIGYQAVAKETGTVSFGHKSGDSKGYMDGTYDSDSFARLTNIAEGKDDNDAVNVKQLKEIVNEKMDNGMSDLEGQINKVGAGAAALAMLHSEGFDPTNKWNFAVGYGHYKNANAGALGAFYKPNADTTVSVASTMGNGNPMFGAGVSFKIGHHGENFAPNASNAELADEVNRLRKVNADQAKKIASLEAQVAQILQKLDLSDTVKKTAR